MSRPTIKRGINGGLYLDTSGDGWFRSDFITPDDAVMLAHEIAGCVPGLVVMAPSAPEDPNLPELDPIV
jgi:hypothetical protein